MALRRAVASSAVVGSANAGLLRGPPGSPACRIRGHPGCLPNPCPQVPPRPRRRSTSDDRFERCLGCPGRPGPSRGLRCVAGQGRVRTGSGYSRGTRSASTRGRAGDSAAPGGCPSDILVELGIDLRGGPCGSATGPPVRNGAGFRTIRRVVPGRDRTPRPRLPGVAPAGDLRAAVARGNRRAPGRTPRVFAGRAPADGPRLAGTALAPLLCRLATAKGSATNCHVALRGPPHGARSCARGPAGPATFARRSRLDRATSDCATIAAPTYLRLTSVGPAAGQGAPSRGNRAIRTYRQAVARPARLRTSAAGGSIGS